MSRFTTIISSLRLARATVLTESRARRSGGPRKAKAPKKLTFDSPELEALFNSLPADMQELMKKV